jgi:hypothetical protein
MDRTPYGEAHFYQGEPILRQSHHDDYACSCYGVAMSGGDRVDFITQVPAVRCAWAPVVMSCRARH